MNRGLRSCVSLKIIVACLIQLSQGAGFDQACQSYVKGIDKFYFNAINLTEMRVVYDNGKYDVECQDIVEPNITDVAPQIFLLQNATEVCDYVTIIMFETNITYGAGNKTFLMWMVTNARTSDLVNGNMGSSATTIVPYLQRTTTNPKERFGNGYGLKRRIFFTFCQPSSIPKSEFEGDGKGFDGREMFKPKQFAQAHDLGVPYSGFYFKGRYLFPNETRNETETKMGRKFCNETTVNTRVCVCLPLGILQGNEDDGSCFLSADVNTTGIGGLPMGGGAPGTPMGGGSSGLIGGGDANVQGMSGTSATTSSSVVGGVMNSLGGMLR